MRRLRAGKCQASAGVPSGYSDQIDAPPGHLAPQRGVAARIDDVEARCPPRRSAARRRASSAPAWAAPSMPRARPDTTDTPAADSSRAELEGQRRSRSGCSRGCPTMATRVPDHDVGIAAVEQDRGRIGIVVEHRRGSRRGRGAPPRSRPRAWAAQQAAGRAGRPVAAQSATTSARRGPRTAASRARGAGRPDRDRRPGRVPGRRGAAEHGPQAARTHAVERRRGR